MSIQNNRLFRLHDGAPIRVRWGGWVSDTYILMREGWKFASDEHQDQFSHCHDVRLVATSPDHNLIISGVQHFDIGRLSRDLHYCQRMWGELGFQMQQYTANDVFRYTEMPNITSWKKLQACDVTMPTFATEHEFRFRDLKVFAPLKDATQNEIYIPEENVDELLNKILKLQYPEQRELNKLILPERKPIIQAKVFSLAA